MLARKLTQEEINERVEKLMKLLGPIGFECAHELRFTHPDVPDVDFDFRALDPEKIIYIVFQAGLKAGRVEKAQELLASLNETLSN